MKNTRIALLVCLAALSGCVSIPDARRLAPRPNAAPPVVASATHTLSPAASAQVLEHIAPEGPDAAMLRQISLEGAMAGRPLIVGNQVSLLRDGPQTYDAMMRAIIAATDHIDLESYLFDDDSVGRAIADLLVEKRRQGVQVQVIYDSIGSGETPAGFWRRLRGAGIQVLEYNPTDPLKARVGYDPNDRDHRKLLVVDGKIAITGGINITETYLYGGSDDNTLDRWWLGWRDTDVEIAGPVVAQFQQLFLDTWKAQAGDPLPPSRFFPPPGRVGPSLVRAAGGTPQAGKPEIYVALLSAIRHAQTRVWLTTAFFDPTEEARDTLKSAARRGVDVELIVPGESTSSATLAAGRSRYAELLETGIKIYERRDVFQHAKTATIDGVWSIVGSSNLDTRSVIWNDEVAAIVLGHDFAGQMEAMFAEDRASAQAIDLEEWAHRPLWDRMTDWAARTLDVLL